jgi:hypothetical protein
MLFQAEFLKVDSQLRLQCAFDPRTRIAVAIVNQP